MDIKVNHFKNLKNLKKSSAFRIKHKYFCIKLFFPIFGKTYHLNYYVSNLLFNDKLSEFESSLSTLEIDKEFIE